MNSQALSRSRHWMRRRAPIERWGRILVGDRFHPRVYLAKALLCMHTPPQSGDACRPTYALSASHQIPLRLQLSDLASVVAVFPTTVPLLSSFPFQHHRSRRRAWMCHLVCRSMSLLAASRLDPRHGTVASATLTRRPAAASHRNESLSDYISRLHVSPASLSRTFTTIYLLHARSKSRYRLGNSAIDRRTCKNIVPQ